MLLGLGAPGFRTLSRPKLWNPAQDCGFRLFGKKGLGSRLQGLGARDLGLRVLNLNFRDLGLRL